MLPHSSNLKGSYWDKGHCYKSQSADHFLHICVHHTVGVGLSSLLISVEYHLHMTWYRHSSWTRKPTFHALDEKENFTNCQIKLSNT